MVEMQAVLIAGKFSRPVTVAVTSLVAIHGDHQTVVMGNFYFIIERIKRRRLFYGHQRRMSRQKMARIYGQPLKLAGKGLAILLCALPVSGDGEVYEYSDRQNVVGSLQTARIARHDTFLKLAYEHKLAYYELREANPNVDPWTPKEGEEIVLPKQFILPKTRQGIHINLAEYRLYYFHPDEKNKVWTFPISIGRGDWLSPIGGTTVVDKLVNPTWYPPASIRKEHEEAGDPLPRMVPPGPDNPFGKYALQLEAEGYFIHGTIRPYGIGMQVTHGCIRMRPEDIETLFSMVDRKTPVFIEYRPFKSAAEGEVIYFEANAEVDYEKFKVISSEEKSRFLSDAIRHMLEQEQFYGAIDWFAVFRQADLALGIPYPVNLYHPGPVFISAPSRSSTATHAEASDLPYLF